jgi:hypothetical protein
MRNLYVIFIYTSIEAHESALLAPMVCTYEHMMIISLTEISDS